MNTLPHGPEQGPTDLELYEAHREHFARQLVESQMISQEFKDSGALEHFDISPEYGSDALIHTLVGDETGGAHHLPTAISIGREGVSFASVIADEKRPDKSAAKFRKEQKIRENGTFTVLNLHTVDAVGKTHKKEDKSSMFPNEWSTEEVLAAIVDTKTTGDRTETDPIRNSYKCTKEVQGVKVIAVVDAQTDKIITACPRT